MMLKKALSVLLMSLFIVMGRLHAQIASFNFSLAAQPVSGWTNVYGDPYFGVRTATAGGITITSINVLNWSTNTNNTCAADGQGAAGGTYFPANVLRNYWYQAGATSAFNQAYPQLRLSGLNKDSSYIIRMSTSSLYNVGDPMLYTVAGRTLYPSQSINAYNNTAAGVTFQQVYPDANGVISVYINTTSGKIFSALSGLQIFPGSANVGVPGAPFNILKVLYYDDYSWISSVNSSFSSSLITDNINNSNFNLNYNTSPEYSQAIAASGRTRGSLTGTKEAILNTGSYLYTLNIFDDHGRAIQSKQTNYTGGTDVSTLQYSFSGQVLRTHLAHEKSGANAQSHTLLTKYAYDHAGRLKNVTKNIDSQGDKMVSQESYNELGQLSSKVIGTSTSETQQYMYNIRGWLTSINKDFVNSAGSTSAYFGETMSYDYGFTNPQLNGTIAGIQWKAGGDGIARAYGFTYDNTSRLTVADFSQQDQGASSWGNGKVDYTVNGLTYDGGGNILSLRQKGLKVGSSATVDSLTYQYFNNSNLLEKVSDGITDASSLGDFKDSTVAGDDYTYDANGNINKDYNRHMYSASNGPGTVFNYLDKPDSIVLAGRAGIHYYYNATGNQLAKLINDYTGAQPAVKNFVYIDGFVYCNDTLQYILQEEGRIRYAKKINSQTGAVYYAYEYDYFIKDHLGNVRTVLTEGRDTAAYAATMETRDSATVAALFSNVYTPVNTVYPKPMAFDSDTSNHYVARLNASAAVNQKTGPSLVLKVMAGDQVQISTFAYYNTAVQPPPNGVNLLPDILGLLSGGVVTNSAGKLTATDLSSLRNALSPNVSQFLNSGRSYDNTQPKAYLNWILFDNQFNYVASNSGVQQVQSGTSKQALVAPLQSITKNGYLYVYVSNESQQDVYFDNLTVKHYSGPLVQEQSYYPFGGQMAGISDKALLRQASPYRANGGSEYEEDYGLNYYNTNYRKYDPLIGRFTGVDALAEQTQEYSPFHFGVNNPISYNDPTGLTFSNAELATLNTFSGVSENWWSGGMAGGGPGGGGGGGMFGDGPYAGYYENLWNSVPDGVDHRFSTDYSGLPSIAYTYATFNGTYSYETPNFHGQESYQDGAQYYYHGEMIKSELPSFSFEGEGEGDEGNDLVGVTKTDKWSDEHSWTWPGWGKFTIAKSHGTVTGKEGKLATIDVGHNKGELEGASITLGGVAMLSGNLDGTVTVSLGYKGYEFHSGFNILSLLPQFTAGWSHTSNGAINGTDFTIQPGVLPLAIPLLELGPALPALGF